MLKRMKILLQDKQTMRYFAKINHQWTEHSSEALDFPNYDKAVEFAVQRELSNVHVVLKFPDHPYDICLPFNRRFAQPSLRS